jgi:hypothetical protein
VAHQVVLEVGHLEVQIVIVILQPALLLAVPVLVVQAQVVPHPLVLVQVVVVHQALQVHHLHHKIVLTLQTLQEVQVQHHMLMLFVTVLGVSGQTELTSGIGEINLDHLMATVITQLIMEMEMDQAVLLLQDLVITQLKLMSLLYKKNTMT